MEWSDPFERETADRMLTVRTAAPSKMFWEAWRNGKEAVKDAGLFSTKIDGNYVVEWIQPSGTHQVEKQLTATIDPVGKLPPGESQEVASLWADPWTTSASMDIEMVPIDKLVANPRNKELYDPVINPALLESVEQNGVKVPVRAHARFDPPRTSAHARFSIKTHRQKRHRPLESWLQTMHAAFFLLYGYSKLSDFVHRFLTAQPKSWTQYPPTQPTPSVVAPLLRMFSRWPVEVIHEHMTSSALCCPHAMFSPQPVGENLPTRWKHSKTFPLPGRIVS